MDVNTMIPKKSWTQAAFLLQITYLKQGFQTEINSELGPRKRSNMPNGRIEKSNNKLEPKNIEKKCSNILFAG